VLAFLAGATLHALIWLLERVPRQRLALAACALLLLGGWWHTQSRVYLRVADIHQELTPAPGQWYPDYVYYRRYVLSYIPSEASVSARLRNGQCRDTALHDDYGTRRGCARHL
jgi:hypothetical protein